MITRAGAYLICATPRSGSTLLCGLLRSTGLAGVPESYFRAPDEQAWADRWHLPRTSEGSFDYNDYVRAAVVAGSTANGVFGARVMWGTMDELIAKLGAADPNHREADLSLLTRAFGRVNFVHLWRGDTVAQAVSWARAEQTGHWQDGDPVSSAQPPYFDVDQIHALVQTIDDHNLAWRHWFAARGVYPLEVHYEDLVADMRGVTRAIVGFVGVDLPHDRHPVLHHRRQADELNEDWTARYRAAAPAVTGADPVD